MINGIIVLEGPDGVGKTTLAETLVHMFGAVNYHQTYRWKNNMPAYHSGVLHHAIKLSRSRLVVLDRLWLSEAIYAAAYRGGTRWPQLARMLDRVGLTYGALNVVCLPPSLEEHRARFAKLKSEREEMYDDVDAVTKLYIDLWEGAAIERPATYVDALIAGGGVKYRNDFVDYVWQRDGATPSALEEYCYGLTRKVTALRDLQYHPALHGDASRVLGHVALADHVVWHDDPVAVTDKYFRALNWALYTDKRDHLIHRYAEHQTMSGVRESRIVHVVSADFADVSAVLDANPRLTYVKRSVPESWLL